MGGAPDLLGNREYLKIWTGQTLSNLGSEFTALALPLAAVIQLDATPAQAAGLSAVQMASYLAASLFAAAYADRFDRRRLAVALDLARGAALLTVPLAALAGALTLPHLYAVAAVTGALSVIFGSALFPLMLEVIEREEIVAANSQLEVSRSVTSVAGPALAGVVVQRVGAPLALIADAASYLVSAACLLALRRRPGTSSAPASAGAPAPSLAPASGGSRAQSPLADLRPMVDALRRDPLLLRLTTVSALLYLSTGLIGGVATLYKVDALRLTPGQLGLIQALGSVGVAAGAVAARALSARWSGPRIMAAACAVFALGGAALPAARGQGFELVALLAAGAALQDAAGTVFGVHQRAMMQSRVELAVLGRVSAAFAFVAAAATLLGFLMSGLFGTWGGVLLPLWAGVAGSLAAAVAFEVRPFAPRRPVRRTLEGE